MEEKGIDNIMDLKNGLYLRALSPKQQIMFLGETCRRHKSATTALLLTLLLGGLGAHRFYLGQNRLGIMYALFCWTFIPASVAFCELFVISNRVRQYNEWVSEEVATTLRVNAIPTAAVTIAEQFPIHVRG